MTIQFIDQHRLTLTSGKLEKETQNAGKGNQARCRG